MAPVPAYTEVGKGAQPYVSGRAKLHHRDLCRCHGGRHSHRRDLSHGDADVSGGYAADRQRVRLLAALGGMKGMEALYEHCGMEITEGPAGNSQKAVQDPGIIETGCSYT